MLAPIAEMVNYYETFLSPQAWVNLFWKTGQEKSPKSSLTFEAVDISNFRGVKLAHIAVSQNNLTLLLGLNESGKTTVLKAIEAFDFRNDPSQNIKGFFGSFRNRMDTWSNTSVQIAGKISVASPLDEARYAKDLKRAAKSGGGAGTTGRRITEDLDGLKDFIARVNHEKTLTISRVIPFAHGNPRPSYYELKAPGHPFTQTETARLVAQAIVRDCPQIFYFEDFKDMVPSKIFVKSSSDGFNPTWYEIIDGLFYSAGPQLSIDEFVRLYRDSSRKNDAKTVLAKVNNVLNQSFTKKWKKLSGVEGIECAEIEYKHARGGGYFELSIRDRDSTTYTVDERSKGAIWYLGFLMKAEFRRKKLRSDTGKSIYLIDEPASNLHSTAQMSMLDDFGKMLEDASVIYTTHSQHLVSPENMKTTYVVKRDDGKVACVRWGDYIKGKSAKPTYYQPLADCLDIVPSSLDLGWKKALIVEGPSDRDALLLMHKIVFGKDAGFAVYVAGSAGDMGNLISINMGWAANFRVLLDADEAGVEAAKKYCKTFSLEEGKDVILHPKRSKEIEKYFSAEERLKLKEIALPESGSGGGKVTKNEFKATFASLLRSGKHKEAQQALGRETIDKFQDLFRSIALD